MGYFPERRHPRFPFSTLPWVFALRLPEPANAEKPLRLEAKNISEGGMKFSCNRKFKLFDQVEISLHEKGNGTILERMIGKVVRQEEIDTGFGERTFGVALEFVSDSEKLRTEFNKIPNSNPTAP